MVRETIANRGRKTNRVTAKTAKTAKQIAGGDRKFALSSRKPRKATGRGTHDRQHS